MRWWVASKTEVGSLFVFIAAFQQPFDGAQGDNAIEFRLFHSSQ